MRRFLALDRKRKRQRETHHIFRVQVLENNKRGRKTQNTHRKMDDDTTTKDDQYLTDVLSYSVDRLAKVRFFVSSSFPFVFTSSSSLSFTSVSFLFHFTIDLQIQSGFGDVKASREETRAFVLSQIPTRRRRARARFSSLFSILTMMILMMRMRLPSNDEYEY